MVIIVFGLPGSGKTWFAKTLAARIKAVYISTDQLRNSLIRDNEGHGVIVRARAEPRLERNVIIHNGHGAQRRAGVVVEAGASPELEGNGIGGNGGEAVQGWPAATLLALAQRNVLSPAPEPQPETVTVRPARPTPPATARPRPRAGTGRE